MSDNGFFSKFGGVADANQKATPPPAQSGFFSKFGGIADSPAPPQTSSAHTVASASPSPVPGQLADYNGQRMRFNGELWVPYVEIHNGPAPKLTPAQRPAKAAPGSQAANDNAAYHAHMDELGSGISGISARRPSFSEYWNELRHGDFGAMWQDYWYGNTAPKPGSREAKQQIAVWQNLGLSPDEARKKTFGFRSAADKLAAGKSSAVNAGGTVVADLGRAFLSTDGLVKPTSDLSTPEDKRAFLVANNRTPEQQHKAKQYLRHLDALSTAGKSLVNAGIESAKAMIGFELAGGGAEAALGAIGDTATAVGELAQALIGRGFTLQMAYGSAKGMVESLEAGRRYGFDSPQFAGTITGSLVNAGFAALGLHNREQLTDLLHTPAHIEGLSEELHRYYDFHHGSPNPDMGVAMSHDRAVDEEAAKRKLDEDIQDARRKRENEEEADRAAQAKAAATQAKLALQSQAAAARNAAERDAQAERKAQQRRDEDARLAEFRGAEFTPDTLAAIPPTSPEQVAENARRDREVRARLGTGRAVSVPTLDRVAAPPDVSATLLTVEPDNDTGISPELAAVIQATNAKLAQPYTDAAIAETAAADGKKALNEPRLAMARLRGLLGATMFAPDSSVFRRASEAIAKAQAAGKAEEVQRLASAVTNAYIEARRLAEAALPPGSRHAQPEAEGGVAAVSDRRRVASDIPEPRSKVLADNKEQRQAQEEEQAAQEAEARAVQDRRGVVAAPEAQPHEPQYTSVAAKVAAERRIAEADAAKRAEDARAHAAQFVQVRDLRGKPKDNAAIIIELQDSAASDAQAAEEAQTPEQKEQLEASAAQKNAVAGQLRAAGETNDKKKSEQSDSFTIETGDGTGISQELADEMRAANQNNTVVVTDESIKQRADTNVRSHNQPPSEGHASLARVLGESMFRPIADLYRKASTEIAKAREAGDKKRAQRIADATLWAYRDGRIAEEMERLYDAKDAEPTTGGASSAAAQEPAAARTEPGPTSASSEVAVVPTSELHVDPARFQYKLSASGKGGVSPLLKDTKKFNPLLGSTILVWRDPADGKTYVVNGHHRFELAQRTGHPEMTVMYSNALDAQGARMQGALQNIADGRGSAIDAAKFFRDSKLTPDALRAEGVSLREGKVSQGLALARLSDKLFDDVVQGRMSTERGVIIGDATSDPVQQDAIAKMVEQREAKGHKVSDAQLQELIRLVQGSGQHTEKQDTLFGTEEIAHSLAFEKADVSAYIKKRIEQDRRGFAAVATDTQAKRLGAAGNKINAERNAQIAEDSAKAALLYDKLSTKVGPVADALENAARRIANGEKPEVVKQETYDVIRPYLSGDVARGSAASGKDAGAVPEDQAGRAGSSTPPVSEPSSPVAKWDAIDKLVATLPDVAGVTPSQKRSVAIIVNAMAKRLGLTPDEFVNRVKVEVDRGEHVPDYAAGEAVLVEGGKAIIRLVDTKANVSTWVHELAHVYTHLLPKDDTDHGLIWNWLGADPDSPLTVAQQEQFARGFERYLADGKAPTPALKSAFASFKQWMRDIYQGVAASVKQLRVKLNPEARAFYARMLGAEGDAVPAPAARTAPEEPGVEEAPPIAAPNPGLRSQGARDLSALLSGTALHQSAAGQFPLSKFPDFPAKALAALRNGQADFEEWSAAMLRAYPERAKELVPWLKVAWQDLNARARARDIGPSGKERTPEERRRLSAARADAGNVSLFGEEEPPQPASSAPQRTLFSVHFRGGQFFSDRAIPAALGEPIAELPLATVYRTKSGTTVYLVGGGAGSALAHAGIDGFTTDDASGAGRAFDALRRYGHAEELIESIRRSAADGPTAVVVSNAYRNSADIADTVAHELHHAWQFSLRRKARSLFSAADISALASEPAVVRLGPELEAAGYDASPEVRVMEVAARLAAKSSTAVGVTPKEAASFLSEYFRRLIARHGAESMPVLEGVVRRRFNEIYDRKRAAARASGEGNQRFATGTGGASGSDEGVEAGGAEGSGKGASTTALSAAASNESRIASLVASVGAEEYSQGARTFPQWKAAMEARFGQAVSPYLDGEAWDRTLDGLASDIISALPSASPRERIGWSRLLSQIAVEQDRRSHEETGTAPGESAPQPPPAAAGPAATPPSGNARENLPPTVEGGTTGNRSVGGVADHPRPGQPAAGGGLPERGAGPGVAEADHRGAQNPGGLRANEAGGQGTRRARGRRQSVAAAPATTVKNTERAGAKPIVSDTTDRAWGVPLYAKSGWDRILRSSGLPENTPIPTVAVHPDAAARLIGPQRIISEVALSSLDKYGGHLLAIPTGEGKSFAIAAIVRTEMPKSAIVLTAGSDLPGELIARLREFGIDAKPLPKAGQPIPETGVFVGNYEGIVNRTDLLDHVWDMAVFDEADKARHAVGKGSSKTGAMVMELGNRSRKALYSTASPFHTALEAAYLTKLGMWRDMGYDKWAYQFGVRRTRDGGYSAAPNDRAMDRLRTQMIQEGRMSTSTQSLEGHSISFGVVPLRDEQYAQLRSVIHGFDLASDELNRQGKASRANGTRAQKANYVKAYLERARIPDAIAAIRAGLDKGYSVVVHAATYNEADPADYRPLDTGNPRVDAQIHALIPKLPSIADALRNAFGDRLAVFAGPGGPARAQELAAWKRGDKDVLFSPYAVGGRGLGMHDTSEGGKHPRLSVHIGPPWDAFSLKQALGRTWRLGTTSDAHSLIIVSDAAPDIALAATKLGPRLAALHAAVSGLNIKSDVVKGLQKIGGQDAVNNFVNGDPDETQHATDADEFTHRGDASIINSLPAMIKDLPEASSKMGRGMKAVRERTQALYQMLADARDRAAEEETGEANEPSGAAVKTDTPASESSSRTGEAAAPKRKREAPPEAPPEPPSRNGGTPPPPPPDSHEPPPPASPAAKSTQMTVTARVMNALGLGNVYDNIRLLGPTFKEVADTFYENRAATMGGAAQQLAQGYARAADSYAELLAKENPDGVAKIAKAMKDAGLIERNGLDALKMAAKVMYDSRDNAELKESMPELWQALSSDPTVGKMVDKLASMAWDGELTRYRRYLGASVADGRHIKRAYKAYSNGVMGPDEIVAIREVMKANKWEDTPGNRALAWEQVQAQLAAQKGWFDYDANGNLAPSQPMPRRIGSFQRMASIRYYLDHGEGDFGPSIAVPFEYTRKAFTQLQAFNAMVSHAAVLNGAHPREVAIDGLRFISPEEKIESGKTDVMKQQERDEIARSLGLERAPVLPEKSRGTYEVVSLAQSGEAAQRTIARLERIEKASDPRLARIVRAELDRTKAQYLVPSEVADAWRKMDAAKKASQSGASGRFAMKFLDFVRQQIFFMGFGLRHAQNETRRLVEAMPGGVLNPANWIRVINGLFLDPNIQREAKEGVMGERFRTMLNNASIMGERAHALDDYAKGNARRAYEPGSGWFKGAKNLVFHPGDWIYKDGGLDQRARLYFDHYLTDAHPELNAVDRANIINTALGRLSKASRSDAQLGLSKLMIFPSWDVGTLQWVLQHPLKSAMYPALAMLALNYMGYLAGAVNQKDRFDFGALHYFGHRESPALFSEWVGNRLLYPLAKPLEAGLQDLAQGDSARGAAQAGWQAVNPPRDLIEYGAGALEMSHPLLLLLFELFGAHAYPGQIAPDISPSDHDKPAVFLPVGSRADEKYLMVVGRTMLPQFNQLFEDMMHDKSFAQLRSNTGNIGLSTLGFNFGASTYPELPPPKQHAARQIIY